MTSYIHSCYSLLNKIREGEKWNVVCSRKVNSFFDKSSHNYIYIYRSK